MTDGEHESGRSAAWVDPLTRLVGYQLRRASAMLMGELGAALGEIGLRPAEATILLLIDANPGCSQSDVGRALGIARANMAPLVAGLMRQGLVDRAPVDGRSQALELSAEGERRLAAARALIAAHEARLQASLGEDGRDRLLGLLDALRQPPAAGSMLEPVADVPPPRAKTE